MRGPDGPESLRLLTVNVNGLGSPARARSLWACARHQRADVIFVQETHAVDSVALEGGLRAAHGVGLPWRTTVAACPAPSPHSAGVAILAAQPPPHTLRHPPAPALHGRVLVWDWDVAAVRLRLLCVYAPTDPAAKPAFFTQLRSHLDTDRAIVMGGDWNCVTAAVQESAPCQSRAAGATALRLLLQ